MNKLCHGFMAMWYDCTHSWAKKEMSSHKFYWWNEIGPPDIHWASLAQLAVTNRADNTGPCIPNGLLIPHMRLTQSYGSYIIRPSPVNIELFLLLFLICFFNVTNFKLSTMKGGEFKPQFSRGMRAYKYNVNNNRRVRSHMFIR